MELVSGSFFFFSSRRRHTRYWRDWSSDVCSSDLRIQPELMAIQTKHKGDPQRQHQEMMKIYQAHGVSPFSAFSGCLPMLIPMPVLFALFFVFQNTIEFRGVSFLWMPDISLHDPFYVLPVLMGLSM